MLKRAKNKLVISLSSVDFNVIFSREKIQSWAFFHFNINSLVVSDERFIKHNIILVNMNTSKLKELEDAIIFGQTISGIATNLGREIHVLESTTMYGDDVKRQTAAELDNYRRLVQGIVDIVDKKYTGIKVAEEAKIRAQKQLAQFEEVAKLYF